MYDTGILLQIITITNWKIIQCFTKCPMSILVFYQCLFFQHFFPHVLTWQNLIHLFTIVQMRHICILHDSSFSKYINKRMFWIYPTQSAFRFHKLMLKTCFHEITCCSFEYHVKQKKYKRHNKQTNMKKYQLANMALVTGIMVCVVTSHVGAILVPFPYLQRMQPSKV